VLVADKKISVSHDRRRIRVCLRALCCTCCTSE